MGTNWTGIGSIHADRRRGRWHVVVAWAAEMAMVSSVAACSLDGLLKSDKLPDNVTDPAITETPAGARAAYNGALLRFRQTFGSDTKSSFIAATGLMSDELIGFTGDPFANADPVDARLLDEQPNYALGTDGLFQQLSAVRQRASQARGLLGDYVPEDPALRAHLYAVEGYAEVMLAELFCSGIPLSTVDYKGDYTLRPGSSTEAVFTHAVALFDSALALAGDSTRIVNLSRVGRARALLGRGDYAAAAAAVAAVPDTFRYALRYSTAFGATGIGVSYTLWSTVSASDREGMNGLDYRTSDDPRTQTSPLTGGRYHPDKYTMTGADTIVLASGVEARLIEAEAQLQAGDVSGWLTSLNRLRSGGGEATVDTIIDTLGVTGCRPYPNYCGGPSGPGGDTPDRGQPVGFPTSDYTLVDADTTDPAPPGIATFCSNYSWYRPCYVDNLMVVFVYVGEHVPTGTGGVAGLGDLSDPGTPEARVDLMFRERAFWLFLTGHRQGDLRRLVRQYQRLQSAVYPSGQSVGGSPYGPYVDAPVPWDERSLNSLFTGCQRRD